MVKKKPESSSILVSLYNNKLLASKVNHALDISMPYADIIALCKEYEFDISKSALSRYREKRKEALETGVPLDALLDKRRKSGILVDISTRKESKEKENVEEGLDTYQNVSYNDIMNSSNSTPLQRMFSDLELLDTVIEKAMRGLEYVDIIEVPVALKAIELKNKITGGQLQGLSVAGLRELSVRRLAKETAMTEAILSYIPAEKHEEVMNFMDEKEKEFYANLDLTEEDRKITKALKSAGFEI